MGLVVEDGTGRDDANAYASLAFASAYHLTRRNDAWIDQSVGDDFKIAALIRATDYLDGLYRDRWAGHQAIAGQALCWPRRYAPAPRQGSAFYGYLPADSVPLPLVKACCEAALRELQTPGGLAPDIAPGERVMSETVGPLSVEYAEGGAPTDVLPVLVAVERLVAPLLRSTVGALVVRA